MPSREDNPLAAFSQDGMKTKIHEILKNIVVSGGWKTLLLSIFMWITSKDNAEKRFQEITERMERIPKDEAPIVTVQPVKIETVREIIREKTPEKRTQPLQTYWNNEGVAAPSVKAIPVIEEQKLRWYQLKKKKQQRN